MKASWLTLAACLAPLCFTAAGCKRDPTPAAQAKPVALAATAVDAGTGAGDLPMPRPEDLPGFPIDALSPPAAKQLFAFAQDDFCYCGCPHTVEACLKAHSTCPHAKRMLMLAATYAASGAKSAEIVKSLNDYYASFAQDKRNTFQLDPGMCMGPPTAPVTLVEFSDFECPYCARARPIVEKLVAEGKGAVRLCFKPFPLSMHAHSHQAAEAVLYAEAHGKFWQMHDLLFENQKSLEDPDLKKYAEQLGLDGDALLKAVHGESYALQIDASRAAGDKAGVEGTPAIFINGRPLMLAPSYDLIAHAVQDELEWTQNHGHWAAD